MMDGPVPQTVAHPDYVSGAEAPATPQHLSAACNTDPTAGTCEAKAESQEEYVCSPGPVASQSGAGSVALLSTPSPHPFSGSPGSCSGSKSVCHSVPSPVPQGLMLPGSGSSPTISASTALVTETKSSNGRHPCPVPYPFGSCKICNDKATGVHYGVTTCEGCKGFFKRSIPKADKYKCFFGGQCVLSPQNRNRCKACRYKRCLNEGMSIEAVKMGRIPKVEKERALEAVANAHPNLANQQSKQDPTHVTKYEPRVPLAVPAVHKTPGHHTSSVLPTERLDKLSRICLDGLSVAKTTANGSAVWNTNETIINDNANSDPTSPSQADGSRPNSRGHYSTGMIKQLIDHVMDSPAGNKLKQTLLQRVMDHMSGGLEFTSDTDSLPAADSKQGSLSPTWTPQVDPRLLLNMLKGSGTHFDGSNFTSEESENILQVIDSVMTQPQDGATAKGSTSHRLCEAVTQGKRPHAEHCTAVSEATRPKQALKDDFERYVEGLGYSLPPEHCKQPGAQPQDKADVPHQVAGPKLGQATSPSPEAAPPRNTYSLPNRTDKGVVQVPESYIGPVTQRYLQMKSAGMVPPSQHAITNDAISATLFVSGSAISNIESTTVPEPVHSTCATADRSYVTFSPGGSDPGNWEADGTWSVIPDSSYYKNKSGNSSSSIISNTRQTQDSQPAVDTTKDDRNCDCQDSSENAEDVDMLEDTIKKLREAFFKRKDLRHELTQKMEDELAGRLPVSPWNKMTQAKRKEKEYVWNQLVASIPTINHFILGFCREVPGFKSLDAEDQKVLMHNAYFQIWMIINAHLFYKGDSYLRVPDGFRYSRFWMCHFLPQSLVDSIYKVTDALNACHLTDIELAILCAIQLTNPDCAGVVNTPKVKLLNSHYLDILAYEVPHNHKASSGRVLIDIFRVLPMLEPINAEQSKCIGNIRVDELPVGSLRCIDDPPVDEMPAMVPSTNSTSPTQTTSIAESSPMTSDTLDSYQTAHRK